jgi:hypothetical protein
MIYFTSPAAFGVPASAADTGAGFGATTIPSWMR